MECECESSCLRMCEYVGKAWAGICFGMHTLISYTYTTACVIQKILNFQTLVHQGAQSEE